MVSKLRDRLGTAGFVVAIIALIAALAGTAFAAAGLSGKQKNEVTAIAKKYAGKPGPSGPKGDTGLQGPAGANGKDGTNGTAGSNGKDGASVTVSEIPTEVEGCEGRGGAEVKREGTAKSVEVCTGEEGEPWTAGGVLPSGKTETGTWAINLQAGKATQQPISFALPLATAPEPILVEGASTTGCPGLENGKPRAEKGKLCLYQVILANGAKGTETGFLKPFEPFEVEKAGPSGTIFAFECESGGNPCVRLGTWAVTAP